MSFVIEQLERVQHAVVTAKRFSSGEEAPWERTLPLVEFSLAWGFTRAGAPRPDLAAGSLAALAGLSLEGQWIASLGAWRLSVPAEVDWPAEISDGFSRLDAQQRFHVDRTLFWMQSLEPWRQPDAFEQFRGAHTTPGEAAIAGSRAGWTARPVPSSPDGLIEFLTARTMPFHLQVRAVARESRAAALGGAEVLNRLVEWFVEKWPRASDNMSTNKHLWCLARVGLVDLVVFALAESVNPLPRPQSLSAAT